LLKPKDLILVVKAILRILIKFAALFSKIKKACQQEIKDNQLFYSKATKFKKRA
jgi:hypothetical protein